MSKNIVTFYEPLAVDVHITKCKCLRNVVFLSSSHIRTRNVLDCDQSNYSSRIIFSYFYPRTTHRVYRTTRCRDMVIRNFPRREVGRRSVVNTYIVNDVIYSSSLYTSGTQRARSKKIVLHGGAVDTRRPKQIRTGMKLDKNGSRNVGMEWEGMET